MMLPLLLSACVALYWDGLAGGIGFFHDDFLNIVENDALRVEAWSLETFLEAAGAGVGWRPLSKLSFALHYYFDKVDPFHFKLVNLLLHLLNGCLVFGLCSMLFCKLPPLPGAEQRLSLQARWFAVFLVTGFWLLAPVNVNSVLYIVQRMNALAAGFCLLGMCCYCLGRMRMQAGRRAWPWILSGFGAVLPAALSKENGALLPLFLFLIEVFFFRFETTSKGRLGLQAAFTFFLYIPALAAVVTVFGQASFLFDSYQYRDFSPSERLLTQARVLVYDLRLILVPDPRACPLFQDIFRPSRGLLSPPSTLASLLLLASVAGVALRCTRRAPVLSFGLLFFFAGHLVESTIIPLELFYIHRNYLPGLGLFLVLGYYLAAFCYRAVAGKRRLFQGFACLVLAAHAVSARFWIERWSVPLAEASLYAIRSSPDSARAAVNASHAHYVYYRLLQDRPELLAAPPERDRLGREHEQWARYYADQAVEQRVFPGRIYHHLWRFRLYHRLHLPVPEEWSERLRRVLATEPLHPSVPYNLLLCEESLGKPVPPGEGARPVPSREYEQLEFGPCGLGREQLHLLWRALFSNHRLHSSTRIQTVLSFSQHLWYYPGDRQRAYEVIFREWQRDPDNKYWVVALVKLLYADGRYQEAIQLLLDYYRRHPFRLPYWKLEKLVEQLEQTAAPGPREEVPPGVSDAPPTSSRVDPPAEHSRFSARLGGS